MCVCVSACVCVGVGVCVCVRVCGGGGAWEVVGGGRSGGRCGGMEVHE